MERTAGGAYSPTQLRSRPTSPSADNRCRGGSNDQTRQSAIAEVRCFTAMPSQPFARSGFVLCCFSFLVLLPQSLNAEPVMEKPIQDAIMRFVKKIIGGSDKKIATQAEKNASPEARRWLRETELRSQQGVGRLETESDVTEDLRHVWELMDNSVKERARMQAAELETELAREAERIKEEEKLTERCAKKVASALKETLCFYVTERARTGNWPNEEASDRFATRSFAGGVECASLRIEHRISRGANRTAAQVLTPLAKLLGKTLAGSSRAEKPTHSERLEEQDDGLLLCVVRLLCHKK
jgi:hypothetical protein